MMKQFKTCSGPCGKTLPTSEFLKNRAKCHCCFNSQRKQYRESHKEQISLEQKKYRENNSANIKQRKKEYREKNKDKIRAKDKRYYDDNKNEINRKNMERYSKNRYIILARGKQKRLDNIELYRERDRAYLAKNREYLNSKQNETYRKNTKDPSKVEKRRLYRKDYMLKNGNRIREQARCVRLQADNIVKRKAYDKEYRLKNIEKVRANQRKYYIENREAILSKGTITHLRRLKTDINYNLRQKVSHAIRQTIKLHGGNKRYKSTLDYLPYTIDELKLHLESQFEPWMTWENHGAYVLKTWSDEDPSTWRWQIDHIEPHSKFKYTSMDCEEFRECWALSNLRPYSGKQNIIDGATRVRHYKTTCSK